MSKRIICFVLYYMSALGLQAQTDRYMVFFKDKEGSTYSIEEPEAYLSERAISRRTKYNIPITIQDLPVNISYITDIENFDSVTVFHSTKWLNGVLVEAEASRIALIEDLSSVSEVRYVAPGQRLQKIASALPTNTEVVQYSGRQSELTNAIQNNMLGIDEMHEAGYTGDGMMIAIFDAGFTGTNVSPYFSRLLDNDRIVAAWDFVENTGDVFRYDDHGTSVLSTISAYAEDDFIGIAPDADVVLCVTEDIITEYVIEEYNWLFAAEYADSIGVDIINTSLGYNIFFDSTMDYTLADMDGNTAVITRAADIAASKGILSVVSVGNEGDNTWGKLVAPADAYSVLAVGAVDVNEEHASFSSTGPTSDHRIKPDVCALGKGTKIVGWDGFITSGSGTSYSAPLIAGMAAGVWQAYPDLNNFELIELIEKGSSQYDNPDTLLGYGVPDFKAIQSEITSLEDNLSDSGFRVYPNPLKNNILYVEVSADRKSNDSIDIVIFDMKGSSVYINRARRAKTGSRIELDLGKLPSGVYILHLYAGLDYGTAKILIP